MRFFLKAVCFRKVTAALHSIWCLLFTFTIQARPSKACVKAIFCPCSATFERKPHVWQVSRSVRLGQSVVELDDKQEEGENDVIGYKPVPMVLWLPQIPRGLVCDRTRTSAERGRRLNALAMAWVKVKVHLHLHPELNATASEQIVNENKPCWTTVFDSFMKFYESPTKDIASRRYQVTVGRRSPHTSIQILVCKSA